MSDDLKATSTPPPGDTISVPVHITVYAKRDAEGKAISYALNLDSASEAVRAHLIAMGLVEPPKVGTDAE